MRTALAIPLKPHKAQHLTSLITVRSTLMSTVGKVRRRLARWYLLLWVDLYIRTLPFGDQSWIAAFGCRCLFHIIQIANRCRKTMQLIPLGALVLFGFTLASWSRWCLLSISPGLWRVVGAWLLHAIYAVRLLTVAAVLALCGCAACGRTCQLSSSLSLPPVLIP